MNAPSNAAVRKVNELVKRTRLARVHAYLIGHLKKEMPSLFGKDKKQALLVSNMEDVFLKARAVPCGLRWQRNARGRRWAGGGGGGRQARHDAMGAAEQQRPSRRGAPS